MSLITKIKKVRDALNAIGVSVNHYEAHEKVDKYIVWAESNEGQTIHADNAKNIQVIAGTIDYFTKEEYDSVVDDIQNALDKSLISYTLNSVQYEEETQYIHYEWYFEVS